MYVNKFQWELRIYCCILSGCNHVWACPMCQKNKILISQHWVENFFFSFLNVNNVPWELRSIIFLTDNGQTSNHLSLIVSIFQFLSYKSQLFLSVIVLLWWLHRSLGQSISQSIGDIYHGGLFMFHFNFVWFELSNYLQKIMQGMSWNFLSCILKSAWNVKSPPSACTFYNCFILVACASVCVRSSVRLKASTIM